MVSEQLPKTSNLFLLALEHFFWMLIARSNFAIIYFFFSMMLTKIEYLNCQEQIVLPIYASKLPCCFSEMLFLRDLVSCFHWLFSSKLRHWLWNFNSIRENSECDDCCWILQFTVAKFNNIAEIGNKTNGHFFWHLNIVEGAFSGLRQFLTSESSLKKMKNVF